MEGRPIVYPALAQLIAQVAGQGGDGVEVESVQLAVKGLGKLPGAVGGR